VVEGRSDPAERLVSHRPDSLEYPAARKSLFLGARDERLNLLLQRIDAGVLVSPAVAQNPCIKILDQVAEARQFQQVRSLRNQKANAKLDRRHAFDQL